MKRSLMPFLMVLSLLLLACGERGASDRVPVPAAAPKPLLQADADQSGDRAQADAACRAFRKKHCANYEGQVDLVAACFHNADPKFTEQCIAVKNCAYDNACGYDAMGAPRCFCGSAAIQDCITPGAANGPCQAQWYAATRTKQLSELTLRFGDISFPAGIAYHFQACDRDLCPVCLPKAR